MHTIIYRVAQPLPQSNFWHFHYPGKFSCTICSQSSLPPPASGNYWSPFHCYRFAVYRHFLQMKSYNLPLSAAGCFHVRYRVEGLVCGSRMGILALSMVKGGNEYKLASHHVDMWMRDVLVTHLQGWMLGWFHLGACMNNAAVNIH